jgi:hypothetical protein
MLETRRNQLTKRGKTMSEKETVFFNGINAGLLGSFVVGQAAKTHQEQQQARQAAGALAARLASIRSLAEYVLQESPDGFLQPEDRTAYEELLKAVGKGGGLVPDRPVALNAWLDKYRSTPAPPNVQKDDFTDDIPF